MPIAFNSFMTAQITTFQLCEFSDVVSISNMLSLFSHMQLPPTTPVASTRFDIDLSGCGSTKGCFRSPRDCDVNDCDAVATWTPRGTNMNESRIEFELQTRDDWVALGFSDDTSMVRHFSDDTNMVQVRHFSDDNNMVRAQLHVIVTSMLCHVRLVHADLKLLNSLTCTCDLTM